MMPNVLNGTIVLTTDFAMKTSKQARLPFNRWVYSGRRDRRIFALRLLCRLSRRNVSLGMIALCGMVPLSAGPTVCSIG
jgi:hypothetical protein